MRLGDGIGRGKKSAAEGASHASSYSAMEDKLEVPPRVNVGDRLISSQAEHSLQWLCGLHEMASETRSSDIPLCFAEIAGKKK